MRSTKIAAHKSAETHLCTNFLLHRAKRVMPFLYVRYRTKQP